MGDNTRCLSPSTVLPGFQFYPSDQDLLTYYLTKKNNAAGGNEVDCCCGHKAIKELNLYNYDPFELPDFVRYEYRSHGRITKHHWFCYTLVSLVNEKSKGENRRTRTGFWRKKGRVKDVLDARGGRGILGTRNAFVFYSGNSANRTDWRMYEYALLDHLKASFVLCRVFVKAQSGKSISKHCLSSCADLHVSSVRHIGVQHDGINNSDIVKDMMNNDYSVTRSSMVRRNPDRTINDQDDQDSTMPVPARFDFQSGVQLGDTVSDNAARDESSARTPSAQDLQCIAEGDYIELNDLL